MLSPVHDAYDKRDLLPGAHRVAMCRLATKSSDWITVSDWEVRQPGWTRTRAAIEHFERVVNAEDPRTAQRALERTRGRGSGEGARERTRGVGANTGAGADKGVGGRIRGADEGGRSPALTRSDRPLPALTAPYPP